MPLRQAVATHLAGRDIHVPGETILITSGSQGVLDAAGKILISPGDTVGCRIAHLSGGPAGFQPLRTALHTDPMRS